MYIKVTESIFVDEFRKIRPDNFSYTGLLTLYKYLEEMGLDYEAELDVIAICCDFQQFDTLEEALKEYGKESMELLQDFTIVLQCDDGSVIVQLF